MIDRRHFEQAERVFAPHEDSFERLARRRERKRRRQRAVAVVAALLLAFAGVGGAIRAFRTIERQAPAGTTTPGDGAGPSIITSDMTLTEDHRGTIEIGEDGVTLDCAGFSVIDQAEQRVGILVSGPSRVTITGCRVTGFAVGILLTDGSSGNLLVANVAEGNSDVGFLLAGADGNTLRGNVAIDNGTEGTGDGFALGEGSDGNVLEGNEARGNVVNGISGSGSADNTLTGNRLTGNFRGMNLSGVSGWILTDNEATGNEGFGFEAHGAREMTWRGNSAIGNGEGGFLLEDVAGSRVERNTSLENEGHGFVVFGVSDGNTFEANEASRNEGIGFSLEDSSGNILERNETLSNRTGGLFVWLGAAGNTMTGNTACGNAELDALNEGDNTWARNRFCASEGL